MTSACSAWVPCEKLIRATSMPAATSRSRSAGPLEAGPTVQTILVRRMSTSSEGARCPLRCLPTSNGAGEAGARTWPDDPLEELAGVGPLRLPGDLLRRAGGDHPAAR